MNLTSPHPRPNRPHLAGWLFGTVLLTAALAGCTAAPDLDRDAARQLQSLVLSVTEAAAADDLATSVKHLDELKLQLDEAAARGEVSFKRHQSIQKSVDAVRADLNARQAEAEAARVAAEQERAAQERAAQEAAAEAAAAAAAQVQAQAAAAAAAAAPPPAVAPAPPADSGKAKGKGKGKED